MLGSYIKLNFFSSAPSGEFKRAGSTDSPGRVHSFLQKEEMCPPCLSLWAANPLQQNQKDRCWQWCLRLQTVIQGWHIRHKTQPHSNLEAPASKDREAKTPDHLWCLHHFCVLCVSSSSQTSDIGMTHNSGVSGQCFEIWFRRRKSEDTYCLKASSMEVKKAWTTDLEKILWDQAAHSRGCSNSNIYFFNVALTKCSVYEMLHIPGKHIVNIFPVLELRMQERVFMGMGCNPFMDIQPSDAAICDRAVNGVPSGRSKELHTQQFPPSFQMKFKLLLPTFVQTEMCQ